MVKIPQISIPESIIKQQQLIAKIAQTLPEIPENNIAAAKMATRFFTSDIGINFQVAKSLQYLQNWLNSPTAFALVNYLKECQITDTASEYGWCICDKELRNKIESSYTLTQEKFDKLIIEHYSENKYERIKDKILHWDDVPFLKERMPIIKSCLYAAENINETDLYNITIPTLLAQENGIFDDIIDLIPQEQQIFIRQKDKLKDNQKRDTVVGFLYYTGYKQLSIFAKKILIKRTFLDGRCLNGIPSLSEEELKKYNKFRNKILHGDKNYLSYGNKKCYIQSWLELELLFQIYVAVIYGLETK